MRMMTIAAGSLSVVAYDADNGNAPLANVKIECASQNAWTVDSGWAYPTITGLTVNQYYVVTASKTGKLTQTRDVYVVDSVATPVNFYMSVSVLTQYDLAIFLGTGGTTTPPNGHHVYNAETVVSVTASASSGYVFDHWIYDDATTRTENPVSVTMNANHGLVPYFLSSVSSLVAVVSPSSVTVNVGASQTFQASASGGTASYVFRWYVNGIDTYSSGASYVVSALNAGTVNVKVQCTDGNAVSVWSNEAVLTVQNPTPPNSSLYVLTVGKSGSGTVTPTEGTHSYPVDSVVTLNAIADSGSSFVCWTIDGANVTSSSSTVTMSVDHAATAFFTLTSDYVPPVPDDNQTLPNDQNQLPSGNGETSPSASPELLGELGLVVIGAVIFFASVKRKRGAG